MSPSEISTLTPLPSHISHFTPKLLSWFDRHGRKDLPWQKDITGYRVWVSEIMLQQTQVATVIPYYNRFMSRFPSITDLALAPIDDVLHHWSGLGYYARARNLHKTAGIIQHDHAGCFPQHVDELINLPGIGRSTAGAISAIAFNQHASILDGNVKRVLSRLRMIEGWSGHRAVEKQLWALAQHLTPKQRTKDYTQAIMDLGATLCHRRHPNCSQCPVQALCEANIHHKQSVYPTPKPKKNRPIKQAVSLLITHNETLLLLRRPDQGIWGGLWTPPQFDTLSKAHDWCLQHKLPLDISQASIETIKHSFSHYHLHLSVYHIDNTKKQGFTADEDKQIWYNLNQPQSIGIAAIVPKILNSLTQSMST